MVQVEPYEESYSAAGGARRVIRAPVRPLPLAAFRAACGWPPPSDYAAPRAGPHEVTAEMIGGRATPRPSPSPWEGDEASGRASELTALWRELEDARAASRARLVFVRGPAGAGKTHLFDTFRQSLTRSGVRVFEGSSARDVRRTFGLFVPLLSELLAHLKDAGVPAPALVGLSQRLAPLLGRATGPTAEDRRLELYEAATELFVLAAQEPSAFLFPDVDAADAASLELFRYLVTACSSPEVRAGGLFVASLRDGAPGTLNELLAQASARTLCLGGLELDGFRSYLLRKDVSSRLFETVGGAPDALERLITRAPREKPVDLFLRRTELLPPAAQQVLALISVARSALHAQTVQEALRRAEAGVKDAGEQLELLVREHLLSARLVAGAPVYRFVRDEERAAYEATLGADVRAPLAQALGLTLEAAGELPAAAGLLLEASPGPEAGRVALAAADELYARGAHDEAMALYAQALPWVGEQARRRAHRQLSELHGFKGELRGALRHLLASRTRGGASEPELTVGAAQLLLKLGRVNRAEQLLGSLAAAVPFGGEPAAERPDVVAVRVEIALHRGRPEEALRAGTEQLPKLTRERPESAIAVLSVLAKAHVQRGNLDKAQEAYERAHALALEHGKLALASEALINLGGVLHRLGERERAARCYREGLPGASRYGQAHALANLGSVYTESGDFELALEHLARAVRWFAWIGGSSKVAHTSCNLARLNHFLGDLDRAEALAAEALAYAQGAAEPYVEATALLVQGEVRMDRRDYASAQQLLDQARERFESVGHEGYAAFAAAVKARAHLKLGERAEADFELTRPILERGGARQPACRVEVELARGELALAKGDLLEAGRAAGRAREALMAAPELEGPSRVYFLAGRLRLAAGDSSGAQAELTRAARSLEELAQRVPQARRQQFLSLPQRSSVLSAVESELRLPQRVPAEESAAAPFGLVGRSKLLKDVIKQIAPIARANATVLIRGESGTGKELLAQAIHDASPRQTFPIIKVNCAAMVSDLLLSELFGHERGAFTGAVRERKGRFELADGGTIFLDEIGDIDGQTQVALLRVLQQREFERVGGTKTIKVDVRVICATNRDLEALIAQGRFRQDLYYRLKGVMLELPPLRDRLEDLPLLASHVLARAAQERGEPVKQLSPEAAELLGRHAWPGNIREFENVLASAAIFAQGPVITPDSFAHVAELAALMGDRPAPRSAASGAAPLPPVPGAPPAPGAEGAKQIDYYSLVRASDLSLRDLQDYVEQQCYRRALLDANGSITEAAKLLKMKRSRLSQIVNGDQELRRIADGE